MNKGEVMSLLKLEKVLTQKLNELKEKGTAKGAEKVIAGIKKAEGEKGPRYFLEGMGEKEFIKMNSNSYLGMSFRDEIIEAEEEAVKKFGVGPGAVRFISGSQLPHLQLEKKLAEFHNREAAMIFSSAYATNVGVLAPLVDSESIILSDELNHNSIINAIKLSRPKMKDVYKHLDMKEMEEKIKGFIGQGKRLIIITDGIFSMRGDHAPLNIIAEIATKYNDQFEEGIITIEDDSHGIGSFGLTGRGTEEYTNANGIDIVTATLGKAFGVNGGYVTASKTVIEFLRESSPFYIYSNPITAGEAAAALKSLEILDSQKGIDLLKYLRNLTKRFENGIKEAGYEILESEHPIVPLMVRDTQKTSALVKFLFEKNVLATGLNFPVVPKGDEEIRFQVNADHTESDIDYVINVLKEFKEKNN